MSVLNRDVRVARRGLRRDRRRRAPKRRKRRNLVKFIPSGDSDFAMTAHQFGVYLMNHSAECGVKPDDVATIQRAVTDFRMALAKSLAPGTRTEQTVRIKNAARIKAEDVVSRYGDIIRANPDVDPLHKYALRIKVKPKKLKQRNCPLRPPMLQFIRSEDGVRGGNGTPGSPGIGGGSGVHIIKFFDADAFGNVRRAKPDGAARLELFIDYVPEGAPIPRHPAQQRGWHNYVQSYTKSPMRVEFPVPQHGAKLIVYWARWADATGAVGQFSKTCVARMEGWSSSPAARAQLEAQGQQSLGDVLVSHLQLPSEQLEAKFVMIQAPLALPEHIGSD